MKNFLKKHDILELLFITMTIGEVLLLAYYNLFTDFVFDQDEAKVLYHTIKMWENKSFIIPNWAYMTTGEWDCTAFLAMPIYGLTKNIFLSFAIANIINILLFGVIVYILLSSINSDRKYIFIALAIIYLPFSWGMLNYTNMLFYGAGQYIYKVLTPISLLALLHYHEKYRNKIVYCLLFIFTLLLIFLTCTSSGLYVPACGLFAIYLIRIIYYLLDKKTINKRNVTELAICLVVMIISYYLHIKWGVYSAVSDMGYGLNLDHIKEYIKTFIGVFEIELNDSISSLHGLAFILKIVLVLFIVIFGLINITKICCVSKFFKKDKDDRYLIKAELISIFAANSAIIILAHPTIRYQLVGIIPLILVAIISFEEFKPNIKFTYALFVVLFILNALLQDFGYMNLKYYYKDVYSRETANQILEATYNINANMIVFYDNTEWAESLRAYDSNIEIRSYNTSEDALVDYDVVDGKKDVSYMESLNCVIVIDKDYEFNDLVSYIKENYSLYKGIGGFSLLSKNTE